MNPVVARLRPGRREAADGPPAPAGTRRAVAVDHLRTARMALAGVLVLRLALSPFVAAVGQPAALWRPRGTGHVFTVPPPVAVVIGLQVVGAAGAAVYLAGRRIAPLVVAWGCLLLLAGLRTSLGKILHNDVLLLLAAGPLLLAGGKPSDDDASTGLDAAAAIVLVSYLSAGWWKVLRSGSGWVVSDNLRWSLAAGRGGSHWPAAVDWLVRHPLVCIGLAAGMLALELGAPLLWLRPRLAPSFVVAAAAMHGGTWVAIGLDYWPHLAVVALVLLPWARMRSR